MHVLVLYCIHCYNIYWLFIGFLFDDKAMFNCMLWSLNKLLSNASKEIFILNLSARILRPAQQLFFYCSWMRREWANKHRPIETPSIEISSALPLSSGTVATLFLSPPYHHHHLVEDVQWIHQSSRGGCYKICVSYRY